VGSRAAAHWLAEAAYDTSRVITRPYNGHAVEAAIPVGLSVIRKVTFSGPVNQLITRQSPQLLPMAQGRFPRLRPLLLLHRNRSRQPPQHDEEGQARYAQHRIDQPREHLVA
jgi:hypothetical protein